LDKLKKGPKLPTTIENPISRKDSVKSVLVAITSTKDAHGYPLIIGEHGRGKTSLIFLALNMLGDTSEIAYVDVPTGNETYAQTVETLRKALGYAGDPIIDSNLGNRGHFCQVGVKANELIEPFSFR
jgi:ABC-type molybdenum transport system ATPase subunit/photorepair protein PhrA